MKLHMGRQIRNRVRKWEAVAIIIASLLLTSCRLNPDQASEGLELELPLGLSWEQSPIYKTGIQAECRSDAQLLLNLFDKPELETIISACAAEKFEDIYIPANALHQNFRDGEGRAVINSNGEPVLIGFSYLHEINPTESSIQMKHERAANLKHQLEDLYGQPVASGNYDDSNPLGFSVDTSESKDSNCSVWFISPWGIHLCNQRVVMVDGHEMSLEFFQFDRFPTTNVSNDEFLKQIESFYAGNNAALDKIGDPPEGGAQFEVNNSIRLLSNWMNLSDFGCKQEGLQSLDAKSKLSPELADKFDDKIDGLNADALAEYSFDLHDSLRGEFDSDEIDKVILYLLQLAANQGSDTAMNEIGASLFFCYQGIQQNVTEAQIWFERARALGNDLVYINLALIEAQNETWDSGKRQKVLELMDHCASKLPEHCGEEFNALYFLNELVSAP